MKKEIKPITKRFKHCVCEGCNGDGFYYDWPAGWIQTGKSKHGKKYQENGIGWWCPVCRKKHDPSMP